MVMERVGPGGLSIESLVSAVSEAMLRNLIDGNDIEYGVPESSRRAVRSDDSRPAAGVR